MRKSVRLVGLMAGTALVAFLGSSCAENPLFASRSDTVSATLVDRALNAARIARANGDLNAAASKLAYLVSVAPDNADVVSEYGKVLTEMGQPDEALAYFRKAKAINSDDWKVYNAEGVAYDEKHDFEAARADYARALTLNPGSTAVLNNAARSRMMAGDLVGAEGMVAQARPTAQENGYFTSTQAQLSELELKSNPNAPVAALTPKMDVQAPAMPPSPAPTIPVEVHKAAPVANAAPRTIVASTPAPQASPAPVAVAQAPVAPPPAIVAQPASSAAVTSEAASQGGNAPAQPPSPQIATAQAPASLAAPAAAPPAMPAVANASEPAAVAAATPADTTPAVVKTTAEAQPAPQPATAAPVASAPPAVPVVEHAAALPAQVEAPAPAVEKTVAAPPTPQAIATSQNVEAAPAPVIAAPVVEAAKTALAIETPKPAPVIEQAKASPAVEVAKPAPAADIAPAAPAAATVATKPALSAAAMREAALEGWRAPAQSDAQQIATSQAPAMAPSASVAAAPATALDSNAPAAAQTERLYIRVGMFRSRTHARHVAARLRPRDVHVTRLTRNGRHWYRVWIRGVGDRPKIQDELASVHSLGYLHARIIAKLESGRHLAQNAATIVASSGR